MAVLHEWRKLVDGPFIGQPQVGATKVKREVAGIQFPLMQCLVVHENGDVWQISEQESAPHGRLSDWHAAANLGGRGIIAEPFYVGEIMGQGTDNYLYHYTNGRWLPLDKIGQFPTNAIHHSARLGRGLDNRVWVDHNSWTSLGGDMRGRPDWVQGIAIVARHADDAAWVAQDTTRSSNYGNWQSLGGQIGSNPTIIGLPYQPSPFDAVDITHLMILARGAGDNNLYMRHCQIGSPWEAWRDLGGDFQGSPTVAQVEGQNDFYCFVRGRDNHVKCLPYENGRWGEWQNWGGGVTSDPVACSLFMDDGGVRIRVLALGEEGALWEKTLVKN